MTNCDSTEIKWENLCHQCGRCCFEKLENEDGTIFFTATPCRYLDVVSRQCKVYERRFEINPDCIALTPELVRSLDWLHDKCGYRSHFGLKRRQSKQGKKNYKGME
nr:YcgN family cysteine cluster protein [Geobacter sp. OR-1]